MTRTMNSRRRGGMNRTTRVLSVIVAASGLAFAALLVIFVVALCVRGIDQAEKVWQWPWPTLAWVVAFPICALYLNAGRRRESK